MAPCDRRMLVGATNGLVAQVSCRSYIARAELHSGTELYVAPMVTILSAVISGAELRNVSKAGGSRTDQTQPYLHLLPSTLGVPPTWRIRGGTWQELTRLGAGRRLCFLGVSRRVRSWRGEDSSDCVDQWDVR